MAHHSLTQEVLKLLRNMLNVFICLLLMSNWSGVSSALTDIFCIIGRCCFSWTTPSLIILMLRNHFSELVRLSIQSENFELVNLLDNNYVKNLETLGERIKTFTKMMKKSGDQFIDQLRTSLKSITKAQFISVIERFSFQTYSA